MEHPLLYTTEMVKALLDGRKTQTRRVPIERYRNWKVGETIWVRELTYQYGRDTYSMMSGYHWEPDDSEPTLYAADEPSKNERIFKDSIGDYYHRTFPSIHMKKELCRIFLEITGLRDERVQDIRCNDADCIAEGMHREDKRSYSDEFHDLWDSINAKRHKGIYAWDKNPEVKVIEFKIINAE